MVCCHYQCNFLEFSYRSIFTNDDNQFISFFNTCSNRTCFMSITIALQPITLSHLSNASERPMYPYVSFIIYVLCATSQNKKEKKKYTSVAILRAGCLLFLVRTASRGWFPWQRTRIDPTVRSVEERERRDLALYF